MIGNHRLLILTLCCVISFVITLALTFSLPSAKATHLNFSPMNSRSLIDRHHPPILFSTFSQLAR
jgi:hypothetical protein